VTLEHGEGPSWNADDATLSAVDTTGRSVVLFDGCGRLLRTFRHDSDVGAALPVRAGGFIVCDQPGLSYRTPDGPAQRLLTCNPPGLRMNDAKVAPDGAIWAGTMSYDQTPGVAALLRWDATTPVNVLLSGRTVSNGLDWTADERGFYYVDSGSPVVLRFAVVDGRPVAPAVAVELEAGTVPDGLCVDVDGCLWVALYGAGQVRRYDPEGFLDTVVTLPATRTTSCAFGGPDLSTLFITTSRLGLDGAGRAAQPLAGRVFAVSTGTSGRPARLYCRPGLGRP